MRLHEPVTWPDTLSFLKITRFKGLVSDLKLSGPDRVFFGPNEGSIPFIALQVVHLLLLMPVPRSETRIDH
jgi:hypothetical protein